MIKTKHFYLKNLHTPGTIIFETTNIINGERVQGTQTRSRSSRKKTKKQYNRSDVYRRNTATPKRKKTTTTNHTPTPKTRYRLKLKIRLY